MKLIIREKVNSIAEPVKKICQVTIDPESSGKISSFVGLEKGDIIVFRGARDPVRLPVGTPGQVLVADPEAEFGICWKDPNQL